MGRHYNNRYNKYANQGQNRMRITKDFDSSTTRHVPKAPSTRERLASLGNKIANRMQENARNNMRAFSERNSPENRKKRIASAKLKYEEESIKTKIAQVKATRRKTTMAGLGMSSSPGGNMGNMGSSLLQSTDYSSMDSMLGFGPAKQQKQQRQPKQQPKQWQGMDDLF